MFMREEEYSSQCDDTKSFGAWGFGLLLSMSERITSLELKRGFCLEDMNALRDVQYTA